MKNFNLVYDIIQGVMGSFKLEGGLVGLKRRKGVVLCRVFQEQDGVQIFLEDIKKEFG